MVPDVTIKRVTLHISNTSREFPALFGARVREAGGKYSDIRGNGSSHRYVQLPFDRRDLIDAIMDRFPQGKRNAMVVTEVETRLAPARANEVLNKHWVFHWSRSRGEPASVFLEREFEERLRSTDWSAIFGRWESEDRKALERAREAAVVARIGELREQIASEAVRIANGANDIERLKELGLEYAEFCAEAGIELDGAVAGRVAERRPPRA